MICFTLATVMWDLLKIIIVVAVMLPACISDWRSREASDAYWWLLGAIGIVSMTIASLSGNAVIEGMMVAACTGMVLFAVLHGAGERKVTKIIYYSVAALLLIIPAISEWDDPVVRRHIAVPIMMLIYITLYEIGLIKGGADAKFLITLTILFPMYPSFGAFPFIHIPAGSVSTVFQFSFAVLFHSALFSMLVPLRNAVINMRNGYIGRRMFTGYVMDISDVTESHVWPIEKIIDGRMEYTGRVCETPIEYYIKAGIERIWVTPMIPFLIPLTAATVFVAFFGNLMFIL